MNGEGEPPERDLGEIEDLLEAMDPDAPVSARGRALEEDDDGWTGGRDAAGGPASGEDEDSGDGAGGQVHDLGLPAPPATDPLDSFVQAARDMGSVEEVRQALAGARPERVGEERADGDLAPVIPVDFGGGQNADAPARAAGNSGAAPGDQSQFRGTPEVYDRGYPRELLAAMDFLQEHVGGEAGERAALVLADHFEETGEVPLGLPDDVADEVDEELQRKVAGQ